MRWNFASAASTMAWTCAGSETSAWIASVGWPVALAISAADLSLASFWISASTTEAPSWAIARAQARPNPWAAPVTSATFPASFAITSTPDLSNIAKAQRRTNGLAVWPLVSIQTDLVWR